MKQEAAEGRKTVGVGSAGHRGVKGKQALAWEAGTVSASCPPSLLQRAPEAVGILHVNLRHFP